MVKDLLLPNEIIVDESTRLQQFQRSHMDDYLGIQESLLGIKRIPELRELSDQLYEKLKDDFTYMIEQENKIVGMLLLKDFNESIEIGCDIHVDYQNKGICQKVLRFILDYFTNHYPTMDIYFKALSDNYICIHIFEKLGTTYCGKETWMSDKTVEKLIMLYNSNSMDVPDSLYEVKNQIVLIYKYKKTNV